MSISCPIGQKPETTAPAGGGVSSRICSPRACPHDGSHVSRAASMRARTARFASISSSGEMCGAAMAGGVSSSQSLHVQVGTRYRDQDPDRASSLGSCLLAQGMYYLSRRAAPHSQSRYPQGPGQSLRRASRACRAGVSIEDRLAAPRRLERRPAAPGSSHTDRPP